MTIDSDVTLIHTDCPLCSTPHKRTLKQLRDLAYHPDELFNLVACPECGLQYINPRPAPSIIQRYYPDSYGPYRTAIEDEPRALMRWMRRRKLVDKRRRVEAYANPDGRRILDIGCSTGLFLAEMQQAGWHCTGIEINAAAAGYARERFGLPVHTQALEEVAFPAAHFDVVTMWDVLEHVYDPVATVQEIRRILAPGGMVVAIVPNLHSLERRVFDTAWVGYDCPRHLSVFDQATLRRLFETNGFETQVLRCGYGGYYALAISVEYWLKQNRAPRRLETLIRRLMYFPGVRLPFEPIFALLDRLGIGNELLFIGQSKP